MYPNIDDAWNNDPVQSMSNKISANMKKKNGSFIKNDMSQLNLSDSLSLFSPNTCDINYLFQSGSSHHGTSSKNHSESSGNNINCSHYLSHLKKCLPCHLKTQKEIDEQIEHRVEKRINEIIVEKKLHQLDNKNNSLSFDNIRYNELLILLIGIVAVLFVFFLVLKSPNKQ